MTMNVHGINRPEAARSTDLNVKLENKDEELEALNSKASADKDKDKKKRSWKKPKDKPMRPLSSYNMFFRKYSND